jgi:hypothetical protein
MNRRDAEKASTCRRLLYMVAELAATFVDRFPDIAKEATGLEPRRFQQTKRSARP